ncbi:hypothetical protein V2G26_001258 [Clonostachys chloroleuca]
MRVGDRGEKDDVSSVSPLSVQDIFVQRFARADGNKDDHSLPWVKPVLLADQERGCGRFVPRRTKDWNLQLRHPARLPTDRDCLCGMHNILVGDISLGSPPDRDGRQIVDGPCLRQGPLSEPVNL